MGDGVLFPLAVLDFALPGVLGALPVAAVPVVLHVLFRQRPVPVAFPAVRLLLALERQTTRRLRLRQALLLAVRVALIAGAVVACAGPRWVAGRRPSAAAPSRLNAVFVLDTSCSMRAVRPDGSSCLDRAKALALQALELLSADSRAALITCSDQPRRVVEALTYDRDAVADGIQQSRGNCRPTHCPAALAEAFQLLRGERAPGPSAVFLFTDRTANGWPASPRLAPPRSACVYVVDVGADPAPNRSVALAAERRGPAIVGVPFQIPARAVVPPALGPATAAFTVEGELRGEARLRGTGPAACPFRFAPLQEGTVTGSVALRGGDALAADDRAFFAARCVPPPAVLLVDGGGAEAGRSSAQRLAAALGTRGPGEPRQFQVRLVVPDGASAETWRGADAVVLVDVASLAAAQWQAAAEYVADGGRLLVMGCPQVQAEGYRAASAGEEPLLPCQIRGVRSGRGPVGLKAPQESRPLGSLRDSRKAAGEELAFTPWLEVVPAKADAVVLRFETGEPALLEHAFGRGRALVFAGGVGTGAAGRAFLRRLVRHASTEAEALWQPIGDVVRVESARGVVRSARLRGPAEERWRDLPLPEDAAPTAVLLPPQDEAGLYEVELTTDAGAEVRRVALNVDPAESDPRRLSAAELSQRLQGTPCRVVEGAEELRALLAVGGRVIELNRVLVPAVLALLVIELLLAGRLYGGVARQGDANQALPAEWRAAVRRPNP